MHVILPDCPLSDPSSPCHTPCQGTYELEVHPQLLAGVDKHVNPTAMATAEAVAAGIRRRRTLAMIGSLYVLTWATHVFLPHWANTPYLFTTGTALVNLWIENVWLTPTVDMDVAGVRCGG